MNESDTFEWSQKSERASEGGEEKEAGGNHTITTNNSKLKKKTEEEEEERKSVGCRSNSGCIQFVRSLLFRIKKKRNSNNTSIRPFQKSVDCVET